MKPRMRIIKRGTTLRNNQPKRFVVVQVSGNTRLSDIVKKYGRNYQTGLGGMVSKVGNKHLQFLWKREKPTKTLPKSYFEW